VPPKNQLTFSGLYGVISWKMKLFIVGSNVDGKSLDFQGTFIEKWVLYYDRTSQGST
jgi:hypothetical protein